MLYCVMTSVCGVSIQRHVVADTPGRDHHARGVHAGSAVQSFQGQRYFNQRPYLRVITVLDPLQLGDRLDSILERTDLPLLDRDQLRDGLDGAERDAEDAPDVLEDRAGRQRAERDDLGDGVFPVLLAHVLDHLLALVVGEVHVDIGHAHAFGVQEPLEQQIVLQRVDVRDPERIGHDAPGGASASRDRRQRPSPARHG